MESTRWNGLHRKLSLSSACRQLIRFQLPLTVAGGSSFSVTSWFGHVAEVFLQVYMVTVIAAIAGSFASHFTSD